MRTPLPALTSLRFFAALLVFMSHLDFLGRTPDGGVVTQVFNNYLSEGYMGVTFFFVLSGFILSYAHAERTVNKSNYVDFLFQRIARIYPLHVLILVLYMIFLIRPSLGGWPLYFTNLAFNASLTQAFSPEPLTYFSFNAPTWSLSVEMFFYVFFPLFMGLKTRWLALLAVAVVSLKLYLASALPQGSQHFAMYICAPLRLADFLTGILLFRLFTRMTAPSAQYATLFQALSLLSLVALLAVAQQVPQKYRYDLYYLAPMALIVLAFAFQNGALANAISKRPLIFLGQASFAFYMVHQTPIMVSQFYRAKSDIVPTLGTDLAYTALYFVIAIGVSSALYLYFESPAKKWTLARLRGVHAKIRNKNDKSLGQLEAD